MMRALAWIWHRWRANRLRDVAEAAVARARHLRNRAVVHDAKAEALYPPPATGPPWPRDPTGGATPPSKT